MSIKRGLGVALLGVLFVAGACKSDPVPSPTPPVVTANPVVPGGSVSKEVSAAGGQVALPSGETLDIPAGAVTGSVKVEVTQIDPAKVQAKPAQIEFVSAPVAFTPHGLTFAVPITITLPFTSTRTDLVVLRLDDEKDTTWEIVPGATFEGGKAKFQTSRFSVYIVGLRLDANATCQELCPKIQACTTDCASGCATARATCLPDAWGRVAACIEGALKPTQDCPRVETCIASEPCTRYRLADGGTDASVPDTGTPDTGAPDTGAPDTGAPDTGAPDAGADSATCGPVATFLEPFARPDSASIGGCWITYPAQLSAPTLKGESACGDDQSVALMRINQAPTTVEYDWVATATAGLETNAMVALDNAGTITSGFFAGVDGGSMPPRLYIKSLGGTTLAGPTDVNLTAGTTYHLAATFNPSGAISVALTAGGAPVPGGMASANVVGGITFNRAGFVVGRAADVALTCVDNFTIAQ
ncbi:MAG: hypothetical protein IPQ09_15755 [Myxococcales bacterium]|nr:hypothetical protein [Myxococcales bacterium]